MNVWMNSDSPFGRILRGLGRRLQAWGTENPEDNLEKDYRWQDPQNESEAQTFLYKRLKHTANQAKFREIALVGDNLELTTKLESMLSDEFSTECFLSIEELLAHLQKEKSDLVIGITSLDAKKIHEIGKELIAGEQTNSIPFEFAVVPKLSNLSIDRMWENSLDFVSPLHSQEVDCFELFEESCRTFEPKTGIRDFMDLVQGLNQILDRKISGDVAEFGSFKGQSGYLMARYLEERKSDKRLFLFDAFESFPVESIGVDHFWSETHEVDFEDIRKKFDRFDNVSLVKGDFTRTFEESDCRELALAFVDCDSYRGTKYLVDQIFGDRLSVGGIMIFEDYGHAGLLGNRVAVHEAFSSPPNAFCFFSQFSGSYFVCKTD